METETDFARVLCPGLVLAPSRRNPRGQVRVPFYARVEYAGGRLSICGVEGPTADGNAYGSCGQCVESLGNLVALEPGWTPDMVAELRTAWELWHLNDMRPYSAAMKAAGWREESRVPCLGYEFTRTDESCEAARKAEAEALAALRAGAPFVPTAAQAEAAARPYRFTVWTLAEEPAPEAPAGYERARHTGGHNSGDVKSPERKTLGWLRPNEHSRGLLGRKIDDGPGYGCKWWREDVPAVVLARLRAFPETERTPAWC